MQSKPTVYKGSYEGSEISSMYPNVYRVSFTTFIGNRTYDHVKIATGISEAYVHRQYSQRANVTGRVTVDHVATLEVSC